MADNESIKTSGELTAKERQIANLKPLKETADMTDEERAYIHEIRCKGGKARGEQMKKAKNLKELANMLLETRVSKERAKNILGDLVEDIPEEDLTNGALLMARMLNEVYENGTAKAAEYIRDTSGQKIKDEIAVDVRNMMTDADRALMENMAEILGVNKPESE